MSSKESAGKIESQESPDKPPGVEELFAGAMEIVLHPWVICDDNIKVRCIAKHILRHNKFLVFRSLYK